MTNRWPMVLLGEVLEERTETPDSNEFACGTIPIIAKIGFNDGLIQIREDQHTKTKMILIRPGDLVVSGINAAKGAIAVYDERETKVITATIHYGAYIPKKDRVDVRFLWWLLRSQVFRDILNHHLPGGIKTELKAKRLLPIPIPLPSLDEQRRTVACIDEMARHAEEAKNLRRISIGEIAAIIDAQLTFILNNYIKRGWLIVPLSNVCEINPPRRKNNYSDDCEVSFVPMSAVSGITGRIETPEKRFYGEVKKGYTCFLEGDVIFARITPCMENGKSAVAKGLTNDIGFGSTEFHVLRPNNQLLPEWLHKFVRHKLFRKEAATLFKGTAGQQRVPQAFFHKVKIPLPSIQEQYHLVEYLNNLQNQTDDLKALLSTAQSELDALIPSILAKAFRGDLVSADEVISATEASKLTDKIKTKTAPFGDDGAIVTFLVHELSKRGRPTDEFTVQKHIFFLHQRMKLPIHSKFERKVAGPWSHELKQKAIFAAGKRHWLQWKDKVLTLGRGYRKGIGHANEVLGSQAKEVATIVEDLKKFGSQGLERWSTILFIVNELKGAGKRITRTAIQAEVDVWPGKRLKEAFSEESVDHTITAMVRQKWIEIEQ